MVERARGDTGRSGIRGADIQGDLEEKQKYLLYQEIINTCREIRGR
jgi:hypothetical protein